MEDVMGAADTDSGEVTGDARKEGTVAKAAGAGVAEGARCRVSVAKRRKSTRDGTDDSEGEERKMRRRRVFTAEEDKSLLDYAKAAYLGDSLTHPERRTFWVKALRSDLKHLKRQPDSLQKRFNRRLRDEFHKWRKSTRDGTDDSEGEESKIKRRKFTAEEDKSLLNYAKAAYLEDPHTPPERKPLWTKASRSDLKHLGRRPDVLHKRFNSHLRVKFHKWRNALKSRHFKLGDAGAGDNLSAAAVGGAAPVKAVSVDAAEGAISPVSVAKRRKSTGDGTAESEGEGGKIVGRGGRPESKAEVAVDGAAGAMGRSREPPGAREADAGKEFAMEDVVDAADSGGGEVSGCAPKEDTVAEAADVDVAEGAKGPVFVAKRRKSTGDRTDESEGAEGKMPPRRVRRREIKVEEDNSMVDYAKAGYFEDPDNPHEKLRLWVEGSRSDLKRLKRRRGDMRGRLEQKSRPEFNRWRTAERSRHSETDDGSAGDDLSADGNRGAAPGNGAEPAEDDAAGAMGRSPEPPAVEDPDHVRRLVPFAARYEAPDLPREHYGLHPHTTPTTLEEANGVEGRGNRRHCCSVCGEGGHSIGGCPERRKLNAVLPTLRELHAALPMLRELKALLPRLRESNALLPRLQALFADIG